MKKMFVPLTGILLLLACNNKSTVDENAATTEEISIPSTEVSATVDSTSAPIMTFESSTYEFEKIISGQKVSYSFKFKNTGTTPLIISNAQATCGCTVPEYPRSPVPPGAEGSINVVYDSAGQTGMQAKIITLTSNAYPTTTQLVLKGQVM
jgi:hypothetical protein